MAESSTPSAQRGLRDDGAAPPRRARMRRLRAAGLAAPRRRVARECVGF
jgi:hypothetical protein